MLLLINGVRHTCNNKIQLRLPSGLSSINWKSSWIELELLMKHDCWLLNASLISTTRLVLMCWEGKHLGKSEQGRHQMSLRYYPLHFGSWYTTNPTMRTKSSWITLLVLLSMWRTTSASRFLLRMDRWFPRARSGVQEIKAAQTTECSIRTSLSLGPPFWSANF